MTLKPPMGLRTPNPDVDRVLRNYREKIAEVQNLPAAAMRVISNVELADATDTPIAHGLGRAPIWVRESSPRSLTSSAPGSTGRVVEVRSDGYSRADTLVLRATGWGMTIVVDVAVM